MNNRVQNNHEIPLYKNEIPIYKYDNIPYRNNNSKYAHNKPQYSYDKPPYKNNIPQYKDYYSHNKSPSYDVKDKQINNIEHKPAQKNNVIILPRYKQPIPQSAANPIRQVGRAILQKPHYNVMPE